MATQRDKRSGLVYHARDRLIKKRMLEWEEEQARASHQQHLSFPAMAADTVTPPNLDGLEPMDEDCDHIPQYLDEDYCSGSDDDTDSEGEDDPGLEHMFGITSFEEGLRLWALQNFVKHSAVRPLLALLRQHLPQYKLPRDARTFLNTPGTQQTNADVITIGGGRLWYHGVAKCLQSYYRYVKPPVDGFSIDFFFDGLPLYKSSHSQFWPICMKLFNVPDAPVMTVGIFCGEGKPHSAEEYLRPFVTEMNELQANDVVLGKHSYWVGLRAIITDMPARSFIKGVKSHTGYHSCHKCTIVGENVGNRTFFQLCQDCEARTDELFRAGAYPLHVLYPTPLTELVNCDIIKDLLTSERMHLVDKGVSGKCVDTWIHGHPLVSFKISKHDQIVMSDHLHRLRLPSDFQRKLRNLHYVNVWKASEHKMFLHYAGFVVLKGRLNDAAYKHYMLLFVAMTFLSTSYHSAKWEFAASLLERFVADYATVYSPQLVNSNVHNLLHIPEDVCRFGPVDDNTAYPFEGKLHVIKKLVHSGRNSLSQVINRLYELEQIHFARPKPASKEEFSIRTVGKEIAAVPRPGLKLRTNFKDQWFLTHTGNIVKFQDAKKEGTEGYIQGYALKQVYEAFSDPYPCPSSELNIFLGNVRDLNRASMCSYKSSSILCKVAAVETVNKDEYIFVPLLHTYTS